MCKPCRRAYGFHNALMRRLARLLHPPEQKPVLESATFRFKYENVADLVQNVALGPEDPASQDLERFPAWRRDLLRCAARRERKELL